MVMEKPPTAPVSLPELVDAFEFVSASDLGEFQAYICINTGTVYCVTGQDDLDEDIPEDIEESDQYISVPGKNDLDLGRDLVFAFVARELPDEFDTVRDFFRRRGAYRRYKDFLASRGMVEKWCRFEEKATEDALRSWCEAYEIPLRE